MDHVVFVCEHGGAKSLIAAVYFTRIASERGIELRGLSVGVDPYEQVPGPVVSGLAGKGIDVSGFTPKPAVPSTFVNAPIVVHFGCNIADRVPGDAYVEDWGDVPPVSEGFERAHDVILQRVEQLVATIAKLRLGGE